ncbi:uncharacterized protein LOC124125590 [Haliotis rufescens]|uniref:uncharacterized protein LOC124125590 n=1 Tax=Haliotis rufescens TaxID=6454 RepID=UPI00201EFA8C|nr:uncharacterized protein LOC124125590 [Haliotis rufescens]XP_046344887.2 uncharacterized protein LOC124125590 [Haliotis rufescens]
MGLKCAFAFLAFSCLVVIGSSKETPTFEELVEQSERRLVKRDILDDIRNAFKSAGDTFSNVIDRIKGFSQDAYEKFIQSLPSLDKEDMQKALDKIRGYYDTLQDKSSATAQRMKMTMDELTKDISANGSTRVYQSSLIASILSTILAVFLSL